MYVIRNTVKKHLRLDKPFGVQVEEKEIEVRSLETKRIKDKQFNVMVSAEKD